MIETGRVWGSGIFTGAGLPAMAVNRPITLYVASTLAAYLGVKPPSGAIGIPLPEVLKQ